MRFFAITIAIVLTGLDLTNAQYGGGYTSAYTGADPNYGYLPYGTGYQTQGYNKNSPYYVQTYSSYKSTYPSGVNAQPGPIPAYNSQPYGPHPNPNPYEAMPSYVFAPVPVFYPSQYDKAGSRNKITIGGHVYVQEEDGSGKPPSNLPGAGGYGGYGATTAKPGSNSTSASTTTASPGSGSTTAAPTTTAGLPTTTVAGTTPNTTVPTGGAPPVGGIKSLSYGTYGNSGYNSYGNGGYNSYGSGGYKSYGGNHYDNSYGRPNNYGGYNQNKGYYSEVKSNLKFEINDANELVINDGYSKPATTAAPVTTTAAPTTTTAASSTTTVATPNSSGATPKLLKRKKQKYHFKISPDNVLDVIHY